MKKYIALILSVILVFLSGCVEKKSQYIAANHDIKEYVVYNISKLPEDLIMLTNSDNRQKDLLPALFEGLVSTNDSGEIVPAIAEKYDISKDGITYSFKIRDDAKWSNGNDITAADFVDFFSKILNKSMGNTYARGLYCVFGVEDYNSGKKDFSSVAIRAENKKNLQIRLNSPCDYLLNVLSEPEFSLRKIDNKLRGWKTEYGNIAYSGPFKIEKISGKNEITIIKNENYWNRDEVKSNKILLTAINGGEKALVDFESNKISLMVDPPLSEIEKLSESEEAIKNPSRTGVAIAFNLKKSGLSSDVNFRKAVSAVINRGNICENILSNGAEPAATFIPNSLITTLSTDVSKISVFDKEDDSKKAEEFFLKVKDYKNKKIKLAYLDNVTNKKVCDAIIKSIKFEGVNCNCQGYNSEELKEIVKAGNYDMLLVEYNGLYDNAMAFFENYYGKNPNNFSGYSSIEYDNGLTKSKLEKDRGKRKMLLQNVEGILMKDMPVIPLYFDNIVLCKKNNVRGIYVTKAGTVKLDKAYIEIE